MASQPEVQSLTRFEPNPAYGIVSHSQTQLSEHPGPNSAHQSPDDDTSTRNDQEQPSLPEDQYEYTYPDPAPVVTSTAIPYEVSCIVESCKAYVHIPDMMLDRCLLHDGEEKP